MNIRFINSYPMELAANIEFFSALAEKVRNTSDAFKKGNTVYIEAYEKNKGACGINTNMHMICLSEYQLFEGRHSWTITIELGAFENLKDKSYRRINWMKMPSMYGAKLSTPTTWGTAEEVAFYKTLSKELASQGVEVALMEMPCVSAFRVILYIQN